jgi:hypothetical protein
MQVSTMRKSFRRPEIWKPGQRSDISAIDEILSQIQLYRSTLVGNSYYYITCDSQTLSLRRVVPGGGKIYFSEIVDHLNHGISDEDIEEAVRMDPDTLNIPGHYLISSHIEQKLRALLEP